MAGQLWSVNSLGGFLYALNLSDELRDSVQPMTKFRQLCDVKDASMQGMHKGQSFTWDVVSNVQTRGRTMQETNTMPETNFTIIQGTLTITEAGNSVPYSGKLEALAKQSVRRPVMKALRNDAAKVFDILAHAQFNATLLRYTPNGSATSGTYVLVTTGTATTTSTRVWDVGDSRAMADVMKERNIPAYVADDYYAIAWPTTLRSLKNYLETLFQYTERGIGMVMNGERGRYENTRYIEQTNIPKGGAVDATLWDPYTDTAEAWDTAGDWIFFCGEDTVAEAINTPEEIRAKIPTDYGRSKGVAWYYLGGFGIVHYSTTDPAQVRVLKVDSAS